MVYTSDKLFEQLKKIIDFPDGVVKATIIIGVDILPIIECEYYPYLSSDPGNTITKRFKLEEIQEDDSVAVPQAKVSDRE